MCKTCKKNLQIKLAQSSELSFHISCNCALWSKILLIYRHFKLTCRPTLRAGLWRTKRQRTLATRPANPTEVKRIPWTAKSKRSKCVQLAIRQLLMVNKLKEKLKRKCTRSKYIGSFRRCCTLDQLQSMRFDDWLTDGQKRKEVISLLYQNGRISKI